MATENRGVMIYLPAELEEYFTQYCTEYNITRKDKASGESIPSLGTGIIAYLKSQILGIGLGAIPAEIAPLTPLDELRQSITQLSEEVAELRAMVIDRSTANPKVADVCPWDKPLAELVSTGLRATEIAGKLSDMGYTKANGSPLDRSAVNSRLAKLPELKQIYDNAR
jgi:hypothetical protein